MTISAFLPGAVAALPPILQPRELHRWSRDGAGFVLRRHVAALDAEAKATFGPLARVDLFLCAVEARRPGCDARLEVVCHSPRERLGTITLQIDGDRVTGCDFVATLNCSAPESPSSLAFLTELDAAIAGMFAHVAPSKGRRGHRWPSQGRALH
jgi:hypothetical protein